MKPWTQEQMYEYASKRYENISELGTKITSDYLEAHRLDVSLLRSLIVQISVISFGIVGFSIPLINNSNIVKTQTIFMLGLLLICFCAFYGLWYINIVVQKSIKESQKGWVGNRDEVREALENERFLMKNTDKFLEYEDRRQKFEDKLKKQPFSDIKTDYFLHFLMFLLSVGIALLFLSLFELKV